MTINIAVYHSDTNTDYSVVDYNIYYFKNNADFDINSTNYGKLLTIRNTCYYTTGPPKKLQCYLKLIYIHAVNFGTTEKDLTGWINSSLNSFELTLKVSIFPVDLSESYIAPASLPSNYRAIFAVAIKGIYLGDDMGG